MKKHRTPKFQPRRLFLEGLESRAMLAGNVTASVSGETLFVTGDSSDNAVIIQQTGTNQFTVVGAATSGTTINNQADGVVFTANNVRNFEIDLRGGNDSLGISNNDAYLAALEAEFLAGPEAPITDVGVSDDALTLRGYANIRGGVGDDTIAVQLRTGLNIFVGANAGSDTVVVEGSTATSLVVNADTGYQVTDGNDYVRIRGVTATQGSIVVNTFAGNDNVILADDSAVSMVINAGVAVVNSGVLDFDNISAARLTASGDILIFGGGNADSAVLSDIDSRYLLVVGGKGGDAISVGSLDVNNATLIGEAGNDIITVDDTTNGEDPITPLVVDATTASVVTGRLHIDAGTGDDTVSVNGDATFNPQLGSLNVWTFGGNDTASLANLHLTGNAAIDLGTGNDDLTMDAVAVDGAINAFLLDGNDTATVSNTTAASGSRARFFGGAGFDTFNNGGGNGVEGTDYFLFGFEDVIDLP